jgi:hypothetical protein
VNASVLKVKLATAIIGISSIHLLKTFINAANYTEKVLMWQTIIHIAFLFSALAIALADRLMSRRHAGPAGASTTASTCTAPRRRAALFTLSPGRPCTTTIRQADLIESVAAALQYISYYHPADYIAHLARAYEREQSPAAKDAIAQILTNSRMCAEGQAADLPGHRHRQRVPEGRHGRALGGLSGILDAVNEGVRRGYLNPTTCCAPACWPTRSSRARTPRTTRRR